MQSKSLILLALKDSIPVFVGYIPLGIVYGFLFVQAGGNWWTATLASVLIYGGAAQYMMVPMLSAGVPVLAIALATLVINFRHVFYGISLFNRYPAKGFMRWFMIFALTDETYSLVTTLPKETPVVRMFWISLFNWCWWILGSFIGGVIGESAKIDIPGLDFVLTSLFAVLLCEQWRGKHNPLALWAALVSYVVARLVSAEHAMALSITFCVAAGIAIALRHSPKEAK